MVGPHWNFIINFMGFFNIRFDMDQPGFFTQSVRSRVIEFILKRKRLCPDMSDNFAFGIERALNDGVYTAAYPLHDVSKN
jgi:anoctamin-1